MNKIEKDALDRVIELTQKKIDILFNLLPKYYVLKNEAKDDE